MNGLHASVAATFHGTKPAPRWSFTHTHTQTHAHTRTFHEPQFNAKRAVELWRILTLELLLRGRGQCIGIINIPRTVDGTLRTVVVRDGPALGTSVGPGHTSCCRNTVLVALKQSTAVEAAEPLNQTQRVSGLAAWADLER